MKHKKLLASVTGATMRKERDDGTNFICLSDTIDEKLKDIFFEMLPPGFVDWDVYYEIVEKACDTIAEAIVDCKNDDLMEYIQDNYSEHASIMTYDLIKYINNYTVYEISEVMKEYDTHDILLGSSLWYDREVLETIEKIIQAYER